MKQLNKISLVLALSVLFGIVSGVGYAYDDGGVLHQTEKSGGTAADPVRVIQLVRNPMFTAVGQAGGDATYSQSLSSGDVVLWDLISDDGVTVNIVGEGGISVSNDAVAGVVVSSTIRTADGVSQSAVADIGKRNWGYIQTYGYFSGAHVDASAITAGDGLKASSTTRKAGTGAWVGVNATGTGNNGSIGFAFDTSSSVGNAEVFVRTR